MSKPITLKKLKQFKANAQKIPSLTCYDAGFARVLDALGIELILVGDSLGEVFQGHSSTIPVKIEHIEYHVNCVTRVTQNAFVMADMPFLSYATKEQAYENAARLMQAGAQAVKLEGGMWLIDTIQDLTIRGIPVCAHLGLLPQSVHKLSGYRQQGIESKEAERIFNEAKMLEQAGADLLVLECIPAELAKKITESLEIPVIGIGAGPNCDGQILVLYDILEISNRHPSSFVRDFLTLAPDAGIRQRVETYIKNVRQGTYPRSI